MAEAVLCCLLTTQNAVNNLCIATYKLDAVLHAVLKLLIKTRFVRFVVVEKCQQQQNKRISTCKAVSKY